MDIVLNEKEARLLGSLMEKELATPDYYPLSLNALTNACNQKSNREPVVSYDEETVRDVAEDLIQKGLVSKTSVGRVPKYEERLALKHNFVAGESAVLCVLLLRGPQTAGAIRTRTTRLCNFDTLDGVLETLGNLEEWSFVKRLPRLPGHKESRYTHLLSGLPDTDDHAAPLTEEPVTTPADAQRVDRLEHKVEALRDDLDALKAAFEGFKRQFE